MTYLKEEVTPNDGPKMACFHLNKDYIVFLSSLFKREK